MYKFIKIFLFILIFTNQLYADKKVVEQSSDAVLAMVNGEPIILSDILFETEQEEYNIVNSLSSDDAKELIMKLRLEYVDELIDRKLILAEYNKEPFPIPNEYITSYIDDMARATGIVSRKEFYENLRKAGVNIDEFKEKIRERVIVQFTVGRELYNQINISPKRLYDYYKANLDSEFSEPEKITLMVIFLEKNEPDYNVNRAEVDKQLREDATQFPYIATNYSDLEITKNNNGILGDFPISDMREEFQEFVGAKKLGVVSEAIDLDDGTYYLMLKGIIPKKIYKFKDIELDLVEKLESKEREKLYKKFIDKLRKNAIIEYYF